MGIDMMFLSDGEVNVVTVDVYVCGGTQDHPAYVNAKGSISLRGYGQVIIKNLDRKDDIVSDFELIHSLGGWLCSLYCGKSIAEEKLNEVKDVVEIYLRKLADKYKLTFSESEE